MVVPALILDAMGVMYQAGDDVAELLIPFIQEQRGLSDADKIEQLYIDTSLGKLTSTEFWSAVGVSPDLEDDYLQRHRLVPGLLEFLADSSRYATSVWCLSNDVSEWSKKLRHRFQLEPYFTDFVISGDVGFRKPDAAIFECFTARSGISPARAAFVDDREKNLDAAASLGFRTILFNPSGVNPVTNHEVAESFGRLRDIL